MGGGIYSQDVATDYRATHPSAFASATVHGPGEPARRTLHLALDPFGKRREVNNETPIVVALDVTRSRGDDTKLMYEKLPMLMGQIELRGYVPNPGISFAAIGDAKSDAAPLQVGQFEADNRLDEVLSRIWIEEGGGGTGQESYELCAYFYSRTNCVRLAQGIGKKGYFFFVGDEGFYPEVSRAEVRRVIGDELEADLDSAEVFRRLKEKFHVFFLYPEKPMAERRRDIDAEIKQRVEAAGGQYANVDIRASLLWNSCHDLDLHVVPPSGEEIFYAHKRSACGGWLDVDMNVRGETTKPVENVRWAKGTAPAGRYRIYVRNYSYRDDSRGPIDFRMEVELGGRLEHFEGTISPHSETGPKSDVRVYEFDFDPAMVARSVEGAPEDRYARYSDSVVLAEWARVIGREHILQVSDPRSIVDVLLGALAIVEGTATLDAYAKDLATRGSTEARVKQVRRALERLTPVERTALASVAIPAPAPPRREGRTLRLR
ncbi:MAG: hypothetical protein U0271_09855 [Polyangiaceae bacterium]